MTTFQHNPPIALSLFKDIKQTEINGDRHYIKDSAVYPSVTTVLSYLPKGDQLKNWINKVGDIKAEEIKKNSAERGQHLHTFIENYLNNTYGDITNAVGVPNDEPIHVAWNMFYDLVPHLNKINNIHCLEQALFSSKFKLAGRVDCIAEYDGVLSIIDFKNARRRRTSDMIGNYFMQTTAYSGLFEDMTGIKVNQSVILMAVENDEPQVFIEDTRNHVKPLVNAIKNYQGLMTQPIPSNHIKNSNFVVIPPAPNLTMMEEITKLGRELYNNANIST